MEQGCRIPRYLDSPITIIIWDVDIFLPGAVIFILGVFTHNMLLFGGMAVFYLYCMTRIQGSLPRGMMGNILHRFGIYPYKDYPDGFISTFRG
ncbi:type IV conjugative transfer system protein TraL [Desulfovibrio sp. OttesenSCG-928-M14]|nr:type IV conjugative transfer system protein TraL [Desulfovibrio sp. OttesenSCG-928-M14]